MLLMKEHQELVRELGNPSAPMSIWQKPLDHDAGHYRRLIEAKELPTGADLYDYIQDYRYEKVQPELFRFLLPTLIAAWGACVLGEREDYGGYSEQLFGAFADKPPHPAFLNDDEFHALVRYVTTLLLKRMSMEESLKHEGGSASPYRWFYSLGSFGVVFPHLSYVWNKWWRMPIAPLAVCSVQYVSCLLYDDNENPVFAPWTPTGGGGPPLLWEVDGNIDSQSTHPANVEFLKTTLSVSYVQKGLMRAAERITDSENSHVVAKMLDEFEFQRIVLEERLEKLPRALQRPKEEVFGWNDVP